MKPILLIHRYSSEGKNARFESVWDALEDDPVRQENLKLRSEMMITISETIKERGLKQHAAAELLHISQPRISALLKGKIDEFRLDTLVDEVNDFIAIHVELDPFDGEGGLRAFFGFESKHLPIFAPNLHTSCFLRFIQYGRELLTGFGIGIDFHSGTSKTARFTDMSTTMALMH